MYKCLFTSDWHIPTKFHTGSWSDFPEIYDDSIESLKFCVQTCVERNVPLVASGDLIDGPNPDPEQVKYLLEILNPLKLNNLPLIYVNGNHDEFQDWLMLLGSTAVNVNKKLFKFNDVTYSGLNYCSSFEKFKSDLALVPDTDVGLYHQSWKQLLNHGNYDLSLMSGKHKICCIGDIHITKVIDDNKTVFISPGPLSPQSVAESFKSYTYLVSPIAYGEMEIPCRHRQILNCGEQHLSKEQIFNTLKDITNPQTPSPLSTPLIVVNYYYLGKYPPEWLDLAKLQQFRLWVRPCSESTKSSEELVVNNSQSTLIESVNELLKDDVYSQFIASQVLHEADKGKASCTRFVNGELEELFIREFHKSGDSTNNSRGDQQK